MVAKIGPKISVEGEPEYRKQMQNIIQQTKTLSAEMKALSSSFDNDKKTLKQNSDQRKLLTQQIENQQKALKEQTQMLEKSTAKYGEADTNTLKYKQNVAEATAELNRLRNELEKLPSSLDLVSQKMQEIGSKVSTFGDSMASTGRTLTRSITAPLVATFASSVKYGAEFDKQMSAVQAVTGANAEEFEALRESAISWGEKTVYTATESAEALYYMGLAGWDAEEATQALGGVLNLASAGGLDLGRASDIVTDAMTAMGYEAKDIDHFVDVLAQTMSNSNTTVDLMGETFKYIAPLAGSLGYNIEDLSIAIGMMANSGIKGSTAGTTLRNIITRMAKPTKEIAEAMDVLGVSLDDGQGNMYSFIDVLRQLRNGLGDVTGLSAFREDIERLDKELEDGVITEEQYDNALAELTNNTLSADQAERARYASMLAGQRGLSGLLALTKGTDEEFEQFIQTIYSSSDAFDGLGASSGMAQTQMDNLQGDFTKLTSALGTSKILISDMTSGPLRDLVQNITELVVKFNSLDDKQKGQILKWGAIVASIGPVLLIGGKLVSGIGSLISVTGAIIPVLTPVATFIGSMVIPTLGALTTSIWGVIAPFAPFIAGAAALVVAGVLLYKNWDTIQEKAQELGRALSAKFEEIKNSITNAWNNIKTNVTNKVNEIKNSVTNVWNGIKSTTDNIWNNIKNGITNKIKSAKEAVRNAINSIKSFFNFNWSLPKIALPHFSLSGSFSLMPPSVPHISVDWYRKAMNGGMILNGATIFGQKNGTLLGGGEAGAEVVVGANSLMGMIQHAVGNTTNNDVVINVYGAEGQSVSQLADEIERRFVAKMNARKAVFG